MPRRNLLNGLKKTGISSIFASALFAVSFILQVYKCAVQIHRQGLGSPQYKQRFKRGQNGLERAYQELSNTHFGLRETDAQER